MVIFDVRIFVAFSLYNFETKKLNL